jgi:hypothetical protein
MALRDSPKRRCDHGRTAAPEFPQVARSAERRKFPSSELPKTPLLRGRPARSVSSYGRLANGGVHCWCGPGDLTDTLHLDG